MSDDELLAMIERCARQCSRGIITSEEMTLKMFDYLTSDSEVRPNLVPQVITLIPEAAMPAFREYVDSAMQPGFRKPAHHYGGERPQTAEEKLKDSLLLTYRVRSWAELLRSILN